VQLAELSGFKFKAGPISVTIHVNNGTDDVHELLDSLHMLYLSSAKMASNVDVHLVIDGRSLAISLTGANTQVKPSTANSTPGATSPASLPAPTLS
jgi:hypothetical protein